MVYWSNVCILRANVLLFCHDVYDEIDGDGYKADGRHKKPNEALKTND